MDDEGILVGCDARQEWLLSWWWELYSAWNSYPVAFVDFGLSKESVDWCKKRGIYIQLPPSNACKEKPVSLETRNQWNARAGEGIYPFRSAWFKKPLAFLQSPFLRTCWLDLDCQVNGRLDPIFECLFSGIEIALAKEPDPVQIKDRSHGLLLPDETAYNSGVVLFRKEAEILHKWLELISKQNDLFMSDQNALSRAIYYEKPSLIELPLIYNWKNDLGPNREALIVHYVGAQKMEIMKQLCSPLFDEPRPKGRGMLWEGFRTPPKFGSE